jgi:hypothetical protein
LRTSKERNLLATIIEIKNCRQEPNREAHLNSGNFHCHHRRMTVQFFHMVAKYRYFLIKTNV